MSSLLVEQDADGRRTVRVGGTTFLVYQIHHDPRSARHLDPLCTPLRHDDLDAFFESSVIAALVSAGAPRAADYFGVLSPRFRRKIPLGLGEILARIARDGFSADVYSFFGRIVERRPWPLAERKHPGILAAAGLLMRRLGIDVDLGQLEAPVIHQNHFLCRSSLYARFGAELLGPALRAMADPDDAELQSLLARDAGYRDPRLSPECLTALFGHPHFGLQPFLAERLFSTWLGLHPEVRVRHVWRGRFVEPACVAHEPEMRRAGP